MRWTKCAGRVRAPRTLAVGWRNRINPDLPGRAFLATGTTLALQYRLPPSGDVHAPRDAHGQILDDLKPETAYFCAKDGKRGGFLIVNLSNTSEIPRFAEPWFLNFDAAVEFLPTMTPEDLARAGLEELGRKWR